MVWDYAVKGILIGLIFGVPAGAVGALTVQRTLEKGFTAGFLTGAGSSAADMLYSAAGIFGMSLIFGFVEAYRSLIQAAGGAFILFLGISILRKGQRGETREAVRGKLLFCFCSSFGAAVMNPATILSFVAAFAAFEINGNISVSQGFGLILGILMGTLGWWLALSGIVSLFRERVTDRIFKWLNTILGSLMVIFGAGMAIKGCLTGRL